ncbi:Uncharacterised protein [Escherichia coli]|nr:Uncharacterised protein [Escherichia coli]STM79190.1 Uncharacterised protein [Escherichia coli]
MFDVFAETASGVTAREQRAGKQNKNDSFIISDLNK